MIQAVVRNGKDHRSQYLKRIRQGERMVITDRGRPVAEIVGYERDEGAEAAWNLVRRGVGEWGGGKPQGFRDAPRVPDHRAEEIVIEDRPALR